MPSGDRVCACTEATTVASLFGSAYLLKTGLDSMVGPSDWIVGCHSRGGGHSNQGRRPPLASMRRWLVNAPLAVLLRFFNQAVEELLLLARYVDSAWIVNVRSCDHFLISISFP